MRLGFFALADLLAPCGWLRPGHTGGKHHEAHPCACAQPSARLSVCARGWAVWLPVCPITATLTHRLSNALVQSTITTLRLVTRNAFGFNKPEALITVGLLALGGQKPAFAGR